MMSSDARLQAWIDQLCEEYSDEAVEAVDRWGEAAIPLLLRALWRQDVDPYGHDTFAEILVTILLRTHPRKASEILVSLLAHENADVRRRAALALGDRRDRRTIPVLRVALYDRNDLVQRAAAHALIRLQYGADLLRSCKTALNDAEPRVRYHAVRYLEQRHATGGLIEATYNEDPVLRQIAVWQLGRMKTARALPALIDALQDLDVEVRAGAVWALGSLGRPEALTPLLPLLHDPDKRIVQLAGVALYKLGYAPTA